MARYASFDIPEEDFKDLVNKPTPGSVRTIINKISGTKGINIDLRSYGLGPNEKCLFLCEKNMNPDDILDSDYQVIEPTSLNPMVIIEENTARQMHGYPFEFTYHNGRLIKVDLLDPNIVTREKLDKLLVCYNCGKEGAEYKCPSCRVACFCHEGCFVNACTQFKHTSDQCNGIKMHSITI